MFAESLVNGTAATAILHATRFVPVFDNGGAGEEWGLASALINDIPSHLNTRRATWNLPLLREQRLIVPDVDKAFRSSQFAGSCQSLLLRLGGIEQSIVVLLLRQTRPGNAAGYPNIAMRARHGDDCDTHLLLRCGRKSTMKIYS